MRARRPYVGPILTLHHRKARQTWTGTRVRWPCQTWATVLFTKERKYKVSYADGRRRICRRRGKRFPQCCVAEANRFGGVVMV